MRRITLPNGLRIRHLTPFGETRFIYREVFESRVYLSEGISLAPGSVVVDVGANIGLFTLFVAMECPPARVFALEPSRRARQALRANAANLSGRCDVTVIGAAAGALPGRRVLTTYPFLPGLSTFHPAGTAVVRRAMLNSLLSDSRALSALPRAALRLAGPARGAVARAAVALLFRAKSEQVAVTTLSDVFERHAIDRVDLLKLDIEGAEAEALRGLREAHWERLRQVVLEVHDVERDLSSIRACLAGHGFTVHTAATASQRNAGTCMVYATRPPQPGTPPAESRAEDRSGR